MQDVWILSRELRDVTSGETTCVVDSCDRPAGRAEGRRAWETDVLCVAHRRRWRKRADRKMTLERFIEEQADAAPILRPRGAVTRSRSYPPIDFTLAPPRLREELRYVVAVKVQRNQWRGHEYVTKVLRSAIEIARSRGYVSLTEFAGPNGLERSGRRAANVSGPLRDALPTMLQLLEAARSDPWAKTHWHPSDMGFSGVESSGRVTIWWGAVTCEWLRRGLMELARQHVQSGYRSWSTVRNYARAGSLLSAFMDEVGHLEPSAITRAAFLDFLAWVRSEGSGRTDLSAVNGAARLLFAMRDAGIVPDPPDTVYLLRGENPTTKTRHPKPFPADILDAVDSLIGDPSALEPDVRLLLRLFRAIGPRASEALMLPIDCVRHTDRGYSLEYYQSKVQHWRRVPLPPRLGEDLAAQAARVRDVHGPDCQWLFPYLGPSPRINTLANESGMLGPWPYDAFTGRLWHIYKRHGITRSELTGETLTGAQLHRFRHSVATGLLKEGWSQYEVQQFLGHKSPTMMQSYAEIHEDDLRAKYVEFIEKSVDVTGTHHKVDVQGAADVERLRDRLIRTTLPNGYCTLPEKQTCDFVPTPCLSCTAFFRTTPTFLPIHIRQRDEALREIDLAKSEGRERAVHAHKQTVEALDRIIDSLQQGSEQAEESE